MPATRVCVLGGGLSAVAAVEQIVDAPHGVEVDIYCELYDPCEPRHLYGHADKPYVDYVPEFLISRGQEFTKQLSRWESEGLVERAASGAVVEIGKAAVPQPLHKDRYRPKGGAMQLCRKLVEALAAHSGVHMRKEQPWALSATQEGGWNLSLGEKGPVEQYHVVLVAYDFCYRLTHVKAVRELLDTGLPHTGGLMGCFGELHAAKCLAITFSVEPPLGEEVPWDAALVHDTPAVQWITRSRSCQTSNWQHSKKEHWIVLSSSNHSRVRFGPGWNKQQAGQELLDAFAQVVGVNLASRKVRIIGNPYHWDLPAPRNHPKGQLGALVDVKNSIAWTGDFNVEPTPEGCWEAGSRAGQLLARGIQKDGHLGIEQSAEVMLPTWNYHTVREGDEDLATLAFAAEPAASAYRGTCNWEQAEKIMEERVRCGELQDSDHVWLDHLPKTAQPKFAATRSQKNSLADASPKGKATGVGRTWRGKGKGKREGAYPASDDSALPAVGAYPASDDSSLLVVRTVHAEDKDKEGGKQAQKEEHPIRVKAGRWRLGGPASGG